MIKILSRFSPLKVSQLSYIPIAFLSSTSNLSQKITYPYVFGGLKDVKFTQNQIPQLMISTYFGEDAFGGFKEAYRSTLYSLAQKDLQNIKGTTEPNLYKNLKFKNVQLINSNAEIQIVCGKYFIALGSGFIRSENADFQLLYKSHQKQIDQIKNIGDELKKNFYIVSYDSMKKGLMGLSSQPSTLQAYEILFRSAMKLVPQGGNINDKTPQIHSLQFQVEGSFNLNPFNMLKIFLLTKIGKFFNPLEARRKVLKQIIGQNFEWKIGDIDRVLKGNMNKYN